MGMSAMQVLHKMDLGPGDTGIIGFGVNTAVGAAASYGIGRLYSKAPSLPRWVAIGGKLAAVASQFALGPGASFVSGSLDAVGQAGVNALALEKGLKDAREDGNYEVWRVPAGTPIPAGLNAQRVDAVGGRGRGMSFAAIERSARAA